MDPEKNNSIEYKKNQYLIIKVGYEGIQSLLKLTPNEEEAVSYIRQKRILHKDIEDYINLRISENNLEDRDEYAEELFLEDLKKEFYPYEDFMFVMYPSDDYCLQEWDGEKFDCICKKHDLSKNQIFW